jgi:hypothetical protein
MKLVHAQSIDEILKISKNKKGKNKILKDKKGNFLGLQNDFNIV